MSPHRADPSHALTCQFVADLLRRTLEASSEAVYREALQGFVDDLAPWLDLADVPRSPCLTFALFDNLDIDPTTDQVAVVLSAEGLALFRAWLRRRGVDPVQCTS